MKLLVLFTVSSVDRPVWGKGVDKIYVVVVVVVLSSMESHQHCQLWIASLSVPGLLGLGLD